VWLYIQSLVDVVECAGLARTESGWVPGIVIYTVVILILNLFFVLSSICILFLKLS
jgi:hypothetical protein